MDKSRRTVNGYYVCLGVEIFELCSAFKEIQDEESRKKFEAFFKDNEGPANLKITAIGQRVGFGSEISVTKDFLIRITDKNKKFSASATIISSYFQSIFTKLIPQAIRANGEITDKSFHFFVIPTCGSM